MIKLETYLQEKSVQIEKALDFYLPKLNHPPVIHEAIRYAVMGNGKRIRPVLTLAVNELFHGRAEDAILPACAIELIHSYSLVHDDLPCLDNDDIRRGKPSCHKQYGEALALLTGDALLTLAFQLLAQIEDAEISKRLSFEIANAAGTLGMIGGQVLDIQANTGSITLDQLNDINARKTGELFKASCLAGAISAHASEEEELRILRFGEYLGFAFQVVDDIIDGDGYLRFMNKEEALEKARILTEKAKNELSIFKEEAAEVLFLIADTVLNRKQ